MITPKGVIATVAGDGKHGFAGEGAKAKSARFDGISGLAVDDQDNLYIADTGNGRIRRITAGKIATVAGGEKSLVPIRPTGIAVDHAGVFYVLETEGHRVRRISSKGVIAAFAGVGEAAFHGDGGPAIGARLANPRSISVNKSGDIYIADTGNHRVRKIDTHGVISTVAGNGTGEELKGYNRTLVASGTNTPAGPLQVGGDALMAICVKCPGPAYPAKARAQRISGTVVLTAIVDKEGHVRDVKVIRGQADLAEAAVAAVRAWQYKPQMLEGKPVEVTASISISFVFR
jgi:TonB family protein